ncbi:MAG TPA: hypothetical protein DCY79_14630 [Planctomycetaceae bacterium]|nr:hypothetical protein [Blastopirellula sp.]HAY81038.1 hypothetical protein [Planctomycetaceae bacterium]
MPQWNTLAQHDPTNAVDLTLMTAICMAIPIQRGSSRFVPHKQESMTPSLSPSAGRRQRLI